MKKFKSWEEDAPTNATGPAVVGTGDDSSTVVVKKKPKVYKRKRRMSKEEIGEVRNYRKEYDNYHAQPEQRERNAARLRARRQMEKWGKVKKFDDKDVHHKDNNPLNNEEENLKVTSKKWNRTEPRLRKEELDEAVSVKEFDSLKKGDIVTIEYKAAMSSGKSTFKVTAKNVVGKARVEKVTLQNIKNPRGVKHFLYKRSTGVTFAQGDMGSQVISFKKEEVIDEWGNSPLDQAIPKYDGRRQIPKKKQKKKKKEEVEESINIQERELTPTELKRREEIAKDLNDADFKKRYGDRWKEVKMGVATNMAKKESVKEQDDPKADNAKAKELKIAKAIAQAQLAIAKEQERVQKLTDLQNKVKDQASEETIMNKKYLKTKTGSLEEATLGIWQDAAEEVGKLNVKQEGFSSSLIKKAIKIATDMGGDMTGAFKKIEKMKRGLADDPEVKAALQAANEQKEEGTLSKVDGRTKGYKEALRRIKMRQERKKAKSEPVTEESLEEGTKEEYQKFFQAALKKFGAKSPAEMDDEKKKKFFDYIEKNWTKDEMKEFSEGELPPALKKAIAAKKAKKNGGKEDEDEDPVGDKKEVKEATKYAFPTLSSSADEVDNAKKIAAKLKRVYKDTKIKNVPGGASGGGKGWQISFTDKEDNPAKVLKALQKTGYDDGDMDTDDLEPYAEGFEKKK
jgi:hypothetical protein